MTALSNWTDVPAFLDMGGYALYVWGAFGMTAAVFVAECVALRGRRQALRAEAHPTVPAADFEVVADEA